MRSTNEIIIAIKENEEVSSEELRMACLVLDSLLFLAHGNIRRLIAGGAGADVTKQMEFPDSYGELGISKTEWEAVWKDPIEWLGASHIPGTLEYESHYRVSKAVYNKVMGGK